MELIRQELAFGSSNEDKPQNTRKIAGRDKGYPALLLAP
jgi:hypothetical protein